MIWVHKILPSTFCLNNIQQSRLISSIQGMFWGTEYYNRTIIDTKLGSTAFQGPGNIGHFCTENELSFLYSQLLSQPSNSEADSDNCIQHSILYSLQDTTDCSGKTPLGAWLVVILIIGTPGSFPDLFWGYLELFSAGRKLTLVMSTVIHYQHETYFSSCNF